MLAISTDDPALSAKFKKSLNAPFPFVPDPKGEISRLYKVKTPVVTLALRFTFVVGADLRILKVEQGKDALDPQAAIISCDISKGRAGG